jgi:PIN domain nuclease of toxin-antitoxin system
VLDAWAVVALLRGEPSAHRVRELISEQDATMSSVNLGEVYYSLIRSHGEEVASDRVNGVRQVVRVDDADWSLVRDAARIKAGGRLSYADSFCIAAARRQAAPVATGDPEILALKDLVEVMDVRVEPSP